MTQSLGQPCEFYLNHVVGVVTSGDTATVVAEGSMSSMLIVLTPALNHDCVGAWSACTAIPRLNAGGSGPNVLHVCARLWEDQIVAARAAVTDEIVSWRSGWLCPITQHNYELARCARQHPTLPLAPGPLWRT